MADTTPDSGSQEKKRRFSFFRFLLKFILGILVLIVGVVTVTALISVVFTQAVFDVLPPEFDAYVRIESASEFFDSTIDLKAADVVLASEELAGVRRVVSTVRNQDLLRSRLFRFLADIRVDAALYPDRRFLAVADLGVRSAVTRLGGIFAPYLSINNLTYVASGDGSHFVYGTEQSTLYLRLERNLVIVASDLDLLNETRTVDSGDEYETLRERLEERSEYDLRILVRPDSFLTQLRSLETPTGRILGDLEFTELAMIEATVANDRIDLAVDLPVQSGSQNLQELLQTRSGAPTILSVLPRDTYYYTISAGLDFSSLEEIASEYLDRQTVQTLERADSAARTAVGLGLDELVFSWTGDEAGAFGMEEYPEPVFFVSIADEGARRDVFEQLLSTMLLGGDETQTVDGVRIPQLVLPRFLRFLLGAFDVSIPEPYYLIESDFLFLSASPEALAEVALSIQGQRLLAGSRRWEQTGARVPAAATISVLFSLDRTTPAFLRGDGPAFEALRLYRTGVANIRFQGDSLGVVLAAVPGAGGGVFPLPGFPVEADARLTSPAHAVVGPDGAGRLYWMERNQTLVEYNVATGSRTEARIGEQSWILPDPQAPEGAVVWAVTDRGAVYRYLPGLTPTEGFPIITGERPSAGPLLAESRLIVPVRDEPGLLLVGTNGDAQRLPVSFDSPFLATPDYHQGVLVGYPKGFGASVERLSLSGERLSGWPVPLSGIAFGSPVIVPRPDGAWVAFITQAGELTVWDEMGAPRPGFPVQLPGVFYASPQWSESASALFLVSEEGRLFRVELDGTVDSVSVRGVQGEDTRMRVAQADGRAGEEVFLYGSGSIVHGFTAELRPLEGFPLSGGRAPDFVDLNGDSRPELVSGGFDDTIYVYSFR